ncbi:hypothetical protein [Streptomyces sp. YPW6]|uniref:hypothetical protein n=1 Tax=Streptomyces sp. YPW6 TaxID=2840373 RepID=UPI003EBD33DA
MSGSAGRRLRELARGRAKPWPDEVTVRFAIGYGALAGLCTTLAVALSLLLAGGPSWGLVPVWFLLLAAGPTLATLLVSRSADRRRPLRALGGGLLSVLFQAVWAAPFSTLLGVVPRADSLLWPALLLCLANGGFCAFVVADVGREKPGRHTGTGRPEHRTGRQRPGGPAGHPAPPGPRARSQQEERAITEFGELLAAHPFAPTLPGVDYVQVADHSLALDAYERAKAAPGGDVLRVIAEGRTALAQLDARMGLDTVRSRTGCFFDPRHGPGVVDAAWAPRGGTPRTVQVCRADAVRLADESKGRKRPAR